MDRLAKFAEMMDAFYEGSRIIHRYESQPRKYGTEVDLYMVEIHTLDFILNHEKITVTELANITNKTKSAITQITNKLEKKGMLLKLRNKEYHKEINLYVTELGRDACKHHKSVDTNNYMNVLKHIEDYDIKDFQKCNEIFTIITQLLKAQELDQ